MCIYLSPPPFSLEAIFHVPLMILYTYSLYRWLVNYLSIETNVHLTRNNA